MAKFEFEQICLPMSRDGLRNLRAPSRSRSQAIGYKCNRGIEYLIVGSTGGQSAESGENLYQAYVEKTEQASYSEDVFGYPYTSRIQLFVNANGDAYCSWKGKLAGRPVCNFYTGVVYDYKRHKMA